VYGPQRQPRARLRNQAGGLEAAEPPVEKSHVGRRQRAARAQARLMPVVAPRRA
jgi:hypothetical protein